MLVIDRWREQLFREYGDKWILISDIEECNKRISEFFHRSYSSILAYISKESLFFSEFENKLNEEAEKRVLYHNKPITFVVANNHNILIEDNYQLFIKYYTEILGKRFIERFCKLKSRNYEND